MNSNAPAPPSWDFFAQTELSIVALEKIAVSRHEAARRSYHLCRLLGGGIYHMIRFLHVDLHEIRCTLFTRGQTASGTGRANEKQRQHILLEETCTW